MTKFSTKNLTKTERQIHKLHNGELEIESTDSILYRAWCGTDNFGQLIRDFIIEYDLKASRKIDPLDYYAYLVSLNNHGHFDLTYRYFLSEQKNLVNARNQIGAWGEALNVELQSIRREITQVQIDERLAGPVSDIVRPYLIRSRLFRQIGRIPEEQLPEGTLQKSNVHRASMSDENTRSNAWLQVQEEFRRISLFDLGRSKLYQARDSASIDEALRLAGDALEDFKRARNARYQKLSLEEIGRRIQQAEQRTPRMTNTIEVLEPIRRAQTPDDVVGALAQSLRNRSIGSPLSFVSVIHESGQPGHGPAEECLVSIGDPPKDGIRVHEIGHGYRLVVPSTSPWRLVETVVDEAKNRLLQVLPVNLVGYKDRIVRINHALFLEQKHASALLVIDKFRSASQINMIMLIVGPTGTGKTFLAKQIHHTCPVTQGGAFSAWYASMEDQNTDLNIFKSNIFGATGAYNRTGKPQKGHVEIARRGTFFIDEIGVLPKERQQAFLQFAENWEYSQVGESTTRQAECRIILATNENLKTMVNENKFRSDLYYRISDNVLELRPLCESPQLIVHAYHDLYAEISKSLGYQGEALKEVEDILTEYDWPGNYRQLKMAVKELVTDLDYKKKPIMTRDDLTRAIQVTKEKDPFWMQPSGIPGTTVLPGFSPSAESSSPAPEIKKPQDPFLAEFLNARNVFCELFSQILDRHRKMRIPAKKLFEGHFTDTMVSLWRTQNHMPLYVHFKTILSVFQNSPFVLKEEIEKLQTIQPILYPEASGQVFKQP